MIQSLLRSQDYQFQVLYAGGSWRWTTRVDISTAEIFTQIRDIVTPYGNRDSIPIPGEVVQAMADSIDQVLGAYPPSILLSPAALSFVVDEGRGASATSKVTVTNNGILGSLLSAQITSSAQYCLAIPANVSGLSANQSGSFDVLVDSTKLLASESPYQATLTVQSSSASNNPQTLPVSVTVRPKAVIAVTPKNLQFRILAPLSGGFPVIPPQELTLSNAGDPASALDYQIRKLVGVPWLVGVSPAHGSINGGGVQPITVTVAPPAGMIAGAYTETLRITGYSQNLSVDVPVTLTIQ